MKVDQSVNKIRIVMPSRNRRHDGDSHPRERKHVFEVDGGKRHFARDQHQGTPLFDDDVGRKRGDRYCRARSPQAFASNRESPPFRRCGTNRTRLSLHVADPVVHGGQRSDFVHVERGFVLDSCAAPFC